MGKRYVYLTGQITGASYEEAALGWRRAVGHALSKIADDVVPLSPLRGKSHLAGIRSLDRMGDPESVLSCARGITTRDRWDVQRSTLVFANLQMNKISVGSMIELGWADAFRVPVIAVMEPGNMHEHAMVNELIGWRVHSIAEGIAVASVILTEALS